MLQLYTGSNQGISVGSQVSTPSISEGAMLQLYSGSNQGMGVSTVTGTPASSTAGATQAPQGGGSTMGTSPAIPVLGRYRGALPSQADTIRKTLLGQ